MICLQIVQDLHCSACTCSSVVLVLWIHWKIFARQIQKNTNLTWFSQRRCSCWVNITTYECVKMINFCSQRNKHTHTHCAVHKLIMHGAHLVHMQTFGRHLMSLWWAKGDTSFLTLQSESDGGWVLCCQASLMKGGIWLCVFSKTLKWAMFFGGGTVSNLEGADAWQAKKNDFDNETDLQSVSSKGNSPIC